MGGVRPETVPRRERGPSLQGCIHGGSLGVYPPCPRESDSTNLMETVIHLPCNTMTIVSSEAALYRLVWRASLGAVPVQLLNARENELGSEKPSSRDISVSVRLLSWI